MTNGRINIGLFMFSMALTAVGVVRWRRALEAEAAATIALMPADSTVHTFSADSLSDAASLTVTNDPFRLANAPAAVSYASTLVPITKAHVAIAAAPRPALVVRAIIGGPPWSALVDGLPGQPPSTMVNPGSVFNTLRVQTISRDTVVVQGSDTLWKLTIGGGGL